MKIVFIASRSIHDIGGIESYMKNLLPKLASYGHEVILYCEGGWFKKKYYSGFIIIEVPTVKGKMWSKIILGTVSTIHSLIANKGVHIYHYNANAAALMSFLPRIFGKTTVYQGHGFEWKRAKWSGRMQKLIVLLDRFVIHVNKNITMVSEEQSEYIRRRFRKDAMTIHSGVDIEDKQYDVSLIHEYSLLPDKYFLYLGRLVPEKKADLLISAFIHAEIKDHKLVIAGDDANEKRYINELKRLAGSSENIVFTGAVFGDTKNALLQHCKAFCIPSELEGLPITLLEAMSFGKLCLASDIQANVEALGSSGLFFKVNDEHHLIEQLHGLQNLTHNCIQKHAEYTTSRINQKFTWCVIAKQFDDYYRKLHES